MEEALGSIVSGLSWPLLIGLIVVSLTVLAKAADWLVDEAVRLSRRSGVSKVVIGATIVSLGTTMPEAVVSVLAALQGKPGLALGNAVGSIICDTGLILGLACLISPLPLDRRVVNRQGWIQLAAGALLILGSFPWSSPFGALTEGGNLPQGLGVIFILLLVGYLYMSIRWARQANQSAGAQGNGENDSFPAEEGGSAIRLIVLRLIPAIALVIGASWVLIPAASEAAVRLHVPESIIAATVVAFGTSLPELTTAIAAARHGHGELAVGNIIGADILNVLFVAGTAAAVTPGGLAAPSHFFSLYFPSMMLVLVVFRIGVAVSGDRLARPFGLVLMSTHALVTILSYVGR